MRRWAALFMVAFVVSSGAWAKKPKGPPPPPPEVQAAYERFSSAYQAYFDAAKTADAYEVQQRVWELGSDGAPFQERLDALKAEKDQADEAMLTVNAAVGTAVQANDAKAIDAQTEALAATTAGLAPLGEKVAALGAEVEAAIASQPATIAMADLAAVDALKLQRIFAKAGWAKEGAGVGGMRSSGYAYENFDVEKGGKVLNVYVIRPDPTADGTGGMPPKDVAARAEAGTVFRYDPATDCYVEIRVKDGASAADAKALLEQVVTP